MTHAEPALPSLPVARAQCARIGLCLSGSIPVTTARRTVPSTECERKSAGGASSISSPSFWQLLSPILEPVIERPARPRQQQDAGRPAARIDHPDPIRAPDISPLGRDVAGCPGARLVPLAPGHSCVVVTWRAPQATVDVRRGHAASDALAPAAEHLAAQRPSGLGLLVADERSPRSRDDPDQG